MGLFENPAFVITPVLASFHWTGSDMPPANGKRALVIVAPEPTHPWYETRYIEEVFPLLARRGYEGVLHAGIVPAVFHPRAEGISSVEQVDNSALKDTYTAVCVIGQMLLPEVRTALEYARRTRCALINWTGTRSRLDQYVRTLWRESGVG